MAALIVHGHQLRETIIGAFGLIIFISLIVVLYGSSGRQTRLGYNVEASFRLLDGLSIGSEVRLAGVPVGQVEQQRLNDDFSALVTMRIDQGINLPSDTSASIHTDGFIGGKFIELQPGGSDRLISPGGRIQFTQDAVILQNVLELLVDESKSSVPAAATK